MQIDDIRSIASVTANKIDESSKLSVSNFTMQTDDKKPKEISSAVYGGDFMSNVKNPGYDKDTIKDETLAEKLAKEGSSFSGAEDMKQKLSMAVAGFSVEDLDEMEKDGYDAKEMEPNEFISVLDKIKMHLAMGGSDISMMGGLSKEDIAAISGGSVSLESTIESAISKADLPADDSLAVKIQSALNKVSEIREVVSDGEIPDNATEYLLRGNLKPTIDNLYSAVFSGQSRVPSETLSEADIKEMMPQIEGIVDEANLVFDDIQKDNAVWMLEKQIPLVPENVAYLHQMQNAKLDLSDEAVLADITVSLSEGYEVGDAYLMEGYSLKDQAKAVNETIQNATENQVKAVIESGNELTADNLKVVAEREEKGLISVYNFTSETSSEEIRAARILEETRMVMTWQANLTLIKRGVSIDTTKLSDLVEELKNLENDFYRNTLFDVDEEVTSEELTLRIEKYENTNEAVTELKDMPAVLLGRIPDVKSAGLVQLNEEGKNLRQTFIAANERYETMETEVRRDLGDSIKKAFRNVDDILEDLQMEASESNRRAVRILAYNQTEINTENIGRMKESDAIVSRVIKDLTPGVVAKMIKEDTNPLDLSMEELDEEIQSIKAVSSSEGSESNFAEFLYKAEKASEITEEERQAYIGIYRLIYQVEKTDGAVIGHLLNQGSEITLRNMMMAVRTRKAENREFTVDDDFGFAEFDRSTLSITEQIEMSFHTSRMKAAGDVITPEKMSRFENEDEYLSMNPDSFARALENMETTAAEEEAKKAYSRQTRDDIENALKSEQRIYNLLEQYDLPTSPANLEAMAEMMSDRNAMYRNLFRTNRSKDRETFDDIDQGVRDGEVDLSDVIEDVMRRFGEAVKTPEEMAEAQKNLEEIAENVMKTMLVEQRVGTIDVRGMQVAMRQIRSMGEIGERTETYAIPILVEDAVGNLTLKIVRGKEEQRGQVDLALDMEATGPVRATFKYDTDGVYGTVTSSLDQTSRRLRDILEQLEDSVSQASGIETHVEIKGDRRVDANSIFDESNVDFEKAESEEKPAVQTRVLYGIARAFIDTIGKSFAGGV